ncbi:helix-turn-helix transcriptional regulator [Actinoplanes sp. NPDC051470]|uniref:helix-turn-helix domain-containing protein n=1 Tax=Actinoplanes sp. NPDC051470 TaxID=3157224 RepID=UPI0034324E69
MDTLTIGERIRHRRLLRGWSVRHAASRAGISHATWSRIERGRQAADNRFVLADIATALECSTVELAGMFVPSGDRNALAAHAGVHAIHQALIETDLNEPADRPALTVQELTRTLDLVETLRRACDYAGAARVLPDLLRDLHALAEDPAQRQVALRMLCHATFLASGAVRNLGHPAEAWLAAERCREAAAATEDPVLIGYAGYARANAALAADAFQRGLAIAGRAVDEMQPHLGLPGALETVGTLQLVSAYASRGLKRVEDSRGWTAEAAGLAARTGESPALGLTFGPTNVDIWRIGIEVDGGEPDTAAGIAATTNPAVLPFGCRQVFYYADAGRALAAMKGRDREAIRYLLTAERVAPQHVHTSSTAQETVRSLLERSRREAGGAELRGLCERMHIAV